MNFPNNLTTQRKWRVTSLILLGLSAMLVVLWLVPAQRSNDSVDVPISNSTETASDMVDDTDIEGRTVVMADMNAPEPSAINGIVDFDWASYREGAAFVEHVAANGAYVYLTLDRYFRIDPPDGVTIDRIRVDEEGALFAAAKANGGIFRFSPEERRLIPYDATSGFWAREDEATVDYLLTPRVMLFVTCVERDMGMFSHCAVRKYDLASKAIETVTDSLREHDFGYVDLVGWDEAEETVRLKMIGYTDTPEGSGVEYLVHVNNKTATETERFYADYECEDMEGCPEGLVRSTRRYEEWLNERASMTENDKTCDDTEFRSLAGRMHFVGCVKL